MAKFRVISEKTEEPIGFGRSIVRQLAHVVDSIICYIGYLWPLWDAKRQTYCRQDHVGSMSAALNVARSHLLGNAQGRTLFPMERCLRPRWASIRRHAHNSAQPFETWAHTVPSGILADAVPTLERYGIPGRQS